VQEIDLTPSQLQILLNMTSDPDIRHDEANVGLVSALHCGHFSSGRWRMKLSGHDIEIATGLFMDHQEKFHTHVAKKALVYLVRANDTAHAYYTTRNAGSDVPRETSTD
jgi:hypothetical protein